MLIAASVLIAVAALWLFTRPRPHTLAEEEDLLREYFRRVDER